MIAAPLRKVTPLFLAEEDHAKTGSHCLAVVETATLPALAAEFLAEGYYLEDISGLMACEGAVSVYHFDSFDAPCRATVLAVAPHEAPVFPSIAAVYGGAEWHERETHDFFGFTYEGNPNPIPLLLPDTMADIHPLAKPDGARAHLAVIFSAENRGRNEISRATGFTMLDLPAPEPAAPAAGEAAPETAATAGNAKTPKDTGKKGSGQ